jgi:hypothetical protein
MMKKIERALSYNSEVWLFQMPTKLADGLGPGSDLGIELPRAVRPTPYKSGRLGPPHSDLEHQSLGYNWGGI